MADSRTDGFRGHRVRRGKTFCYPKVGREWVWGSRLILLRKEMVGAEILSVLGLGEDRGLSEAGIFLLKYMV